MAVFKTASVLLGLAAISAAAPLTTPANSMFRRQEGVTADLCTNADLTGPEGAAAVWNDHGIGTYLDEWISGHGEDNWLSNLASEALPSVGDTGAVGCGYRDQPCLSAMDKCPAMVSAARGTEFWIFNAVQKMQDSFERAHENLQDSAIDSALSVSSIASDFKVTLTTDDKTLRYVAAAFGMAGGLVGYGAGPLVNGLKTTATMFGGMFAASANTAPVVIDPSKAMETTLKEIFKSQITILDGTLKLAVGGGGDYASLPGQSGEYGSSVAKFMADGKFLLQGELVTQYFSAGYAALNKKLVDVALQQYGYHVFADQNYGDSESCAGQPGAHWMDLGGGRCMRLVYQDGTNNVYWPASETAIKAAEEKYGIDILEYYTASCDCSLNGSGEPDTEALPTDGSLPQCFYNIDCQDADVCQESTGDWSICWPNKDFATPVETPTEEPPAEEPPVDEDPHNEDEPSDQGDTGCYSGGLAFTNLHGDGATPTSEVTSDIYTTCQEADGYVIKFGAAWSHCSEWTKTDGGINHIWWEIQHDYSSTEDRTITYDNCNTALNTELSGCSTGSEQYSGGLWFKIDPNEGACPE